MTGGVVASHETGGSKPATKPTMTTALPDLDDEDDDLLASVIGQGTRASQPTGPAVAASGPSGPSGFASGSGSEGGARREGLGIGAGSWAATPSAPMGSGSLLGPAAEARPKASVPGASSLAVWDVDLGDEDGDGERKETRSGDAGLGKRGGVGGGGPVSRPYVGHEATGGRPKW